MQLRQLLRLPQFRTHSSRMGKVIRVQASTIRYYERDGRVQEIVRRM